MKNVFEWEIFKLGKLFLRHDKRWLTRLFFLSTKPKNYWIRTFSVFKQHFYLSITPAWDMFTLWLGGTYEQHPTSQIHWQKSFFLTPFFCCFSRFNPTQMRLIALISFNFVVYTHRKCMDENKLNGLCLLGGEEKVGRHGKICGNSMLVFSAD